MIQFMRFEFKRIRIEIDWNFTKNPNPIKPTDSDLDKDRILIQIIFFFKLNFVCLKSFISTVRKWMLNLKEIKKKVINISSDMLPFLKKVKHVSGWIFCLT